MRAILYEESRPADMRDVISKTPIAYVPLGALEWHGEHGPLGLDGIKARALCQEAAGRTGGVVFPAVFWGAFDTMPFPFTLHFKKKELKKLVRRTLDQLGGWGFKIIVLLTGHYPPTLISMLKKECRRFNKAGGVFAIGAPETMFATDMGYYGDHAGMWETSIMMALRPQLVDLSAMPEGLPVMERLEKYGVMGKDPVSKASAEKGKEAIEHIVAKLAKTVTKAMDEKSDRAFEEIYESYEKALNIFSPKIIKTARDALDVRSPGEFLKYAKWNLRNMIFKKNS